MNTQRKELFLRENRASWKVHWQLGLVIWINVRICRYRHDPVAQQV